MPYIRIRAYTSGPGILFGPGQTAGGYGFQDVNCWYHFFTASQRPAVEAEIAGLRYVMYPTTLSGYGEPVFIVISWDELLDYALNNVQGLTMPWVTLKIGLGEVLNNRDHERAHGFLLFDP